MTVMPSLITSLQSAIRNVADVDLTGVVVYLFGSATRSRSPQDVDVIIRYPDRLDNSEAIALKNRLAQAIEAIADLPIDMTLLSDAEAVSTQFPVAESAIEIWPSRGHVA